MEHESLLEYSVGKNKTTFSDVPLFWLFPKFYAGTTDQILVMFHLLSNRIFRNLFVTGKQPQNHLRDGIEVRRSEPERFHFFRLHLRLLPSRTFLFLENQYSWSRKQNRKDKPITMHFHTLFDWFIFSTSASDSGNLVYTRLISGT